MKKIAFLGLPLLVIPTIVGFSFRSINEVSATDVGDATYRPFILSTNNKVDVGDNDVYLSFDNGLTTTKMKKISSVNNQSYYAVNVLSNEVGSNIQFRFGSYATQSIAVDNSTNVYVLQGTGTHSSLKTDFAKTLTYLESSYTTRRLWFKFSSSLSVFPRIFSSDLSKGYMMNEYNNGEYYYVDIPSSLAKIRINSVNITCDTNTSIVAEKTYSNAELHRINYIDMSKSTKTCEEYALESANKYFVNEYLRGFTSCLESSINGYLAYDPYITNITSKCSDSLNDVFQDDYLESDYDENSGYHSSSIRGGSNVSAFEKLNQISNNFQNKNLRIISSNNDTSNNIFTISFITLSVLFISGYVVTTTLKRKRR